MSLQGYRYYSEGLPLIAGKIQALKNRDFLITAPVVMKRRTKTAIIPANILMLRIITIVQRTACSETNLRINAHSTTFVQMLSEIYFWK